MQCLALLMQCLTGCNAQSSGWDCMVSPGAVLLTCPAADRLLQTADASPQRMWTWRWRSELDGRTRCNAPHPLPLPTSTCRECGCGGGGQPAAVVRLPARRRDPLLRHPHLPAVSVYDVCLNCFAALRRGLYLLSCVILCSDILTFLPCIGSRLRSMFCWLVLTGWISWPETWPSSQLSPLSCRDWMYDACLLDLLRCFRGQRSPVLAAARPAAAAALIVTHCRGVHMPR